MTKYNILSLIAAGALCLAAQARAGKPAEWCYVPGGADGTVELYPREAKPRATFYQAGPVLVHAPSVHPPMPLALDWMEMDAWTSAKGVEAFHFHRHAIYRFTYTHKPPGRTGTQSAAYYDVLLAYVVEEGAESGGMKPFFLLGGEKAANSELKMTHGEDGSPVIEIHGPVPGSANETAAWTVVWSAAGPRLAQAKFYGAGAPGTVYHYDGKDKRLLLSGQGDDE